MIRDCLRCVYTRYLRSQLKNLFHGGFLPSATRGEIKSPSAEYVNEIWCYGTSETITIRQPVHIGGIPADLTDKIGVWENKPPFVAQIKNVSLVGPDTIPIAPDNSYILEGVEGSTERAIDAIIRSLLNGILPIRRSSRSEYEVAVSLAGPWSDQFFHWFVEYLPRVLTVEEYAEHSAIEPVYIVPASQPNWMTRSLELLEIPSDRIDSSNGRRANVQRFILPSLWRHTESTAPDEGYVHSPQGIREVSNRLRENVAKDKAKKGAGPKLYISRSNAPTRGVVNESQLQPVLEKYGFKLVRPETWTLDEQIATFANAEVIAGPHGGGLTNAMYADKPKVMEFFGQNTNPCYFALFAGSGWEYGLVNGEAVGSDIRVNLDDFRQLCEEMLD